MSSLREDLFHAILAIPDDEVDTALAAAIPDAALEEAEPLAQVMLQRNTPQALLPLLLRFHALPRRAQAMIVAEVDTLAPSLLQAARESRSHGPGNVTSIVQRTRQPRHAYLLAEVLRYGGNQAKHESGELIHAMTQTAVTPIDRVHPDDRVGHQESIDYLLPAIDQALQSFDHHRQTGVVLAAFEVLPQLSPRTLSKAAKRSEFLAAALDQQLRHPDHASTRRALIPMLLQPEHHEAVLAGLARVGTADRGVKGGAGVSDLLRHAHLLQLPRLRAAMEKLQHPARLIPVAEAMTRWRPIRARAFAQWVAALPLAEAQRLNALSRIASHEDPAARLAAVRQLIELAAEDPDEVGRYLVAFCNDGHPSVARIALRHLIASKWPKLANHLGDLAASPHHDVRHLAGEAIGPDAFERFWSSWPKLPADRRRAAGRALIKVIPRFHEMLGRRLAIPGPSRLQSLAIIRELGQGAFFDQALATLSRDRDPKLAAAAISALGTADSTRAADALHLHLEHPDHRVRANAIEAMDQLQARQHLAQITEIAAEKDQHNRTRANAIKALLRAEVNTEDAMAALADMLHDPRAQQRTSALWLVEHMGLLEVLRAVAELALADDDRSVKQRANGVVRQLVQLTKRPGHENKVQQAQVNATTTTPHSNQPSNERSNQAGHEPGNDLERSA